MEPLDAARAVIAEQFPSAVAAFLGGSALTRFRTATSDLDLVVVLPTLPAPYRQTVRAHGWLVELFVHTRRSLDHFCATDIAARRAPLLDLCASGAVLISHDGVAEAIQSGARQTLAAGPAPLTGEEQERRRYHLTGLLDDLEGCTDPAEIPFIAAEILQKASEFALLGARHWLGTGKWLLRRLAELDPARAHDLVEAHRVTVAEGDRTSLLTVAGEILRRSGGPLREGYRAAGRLRTGLHVTHDAVADAAYVAFRPIGAGEAVENVVIGRPDQGEIVLDFTTTGTLLGVEFVGARELAPPELLAGAERLDRP